MFFAQVTREKEHHFKSILNLKDDENQRKEYQSEVFIKGSGFVKVSSSTIYSEFIFYLIVHLTN